MVKKLQASIATLGALVSTGTPVFLRDEKRYRRAICIVIRGKKNRGQKHFSPHRKSGATINFEDLKTISKLMVSPDFQ